MNINLNDNKLVKIVYRLDGATILNFNYSDGELCSVTNGNEKKNNAVSNVEMDEFLEDGKPKYAYYDKLKKENNFGKAKLNHGIKLANKIIKMDKNGELDKIAKKHRNEINDKISYGYDYKDSDGKQIDITICNKSIDKLKDEIISMLPKLENNGNNKFWDKVNAYKEYFNKRNQLTDELFNERVEKLELETNT